MIRLPEKFNTISFKISALVGIVCFVLVAAMVGRSILTLQESEIASAKDNTLSMAHDYAGRFKSELENTLVITNTLANTFESNTNTNNQNKISRETANNILKDVLASNTDLLGTWTLWEPNAFDGKDAEYVSTTGHDSTGRFIPYWIRTGNGYICEPVMNYEKEGDGDFYLIPRKSKKELVFGPFKYPIDGKEIMMVSMITPVIKNDKFYGIAAADISVDWIQNWVDQINIYNNEGKITVMSYDGTVVASTGRSELAGKNIDSLFEGYSKEKAGLDKSGIDIKEGVMRTHVPMYLGKSTEPWQVIITVPMDVLTSGAKIEMLKQLATGAVFLLVIVAMIIYLTRSLIRPVKQITEVADKVAVGDFALQQVATSTREINKLNSAFERVVESQKDITNVCTAIAAGDFSKKAIVKSDKDQLSKAVNKMIDNLKSAAEEDAKRNWATEGMAKFAEILRADKDLKKLADALISNLVKYLDANQGWVFIYNDADKNDLHLEMLSCYAYDKKKFVEKRIELGEGLAGQCFIEKSTIYMTDIPEDYMTITSGIGEAAPGSVLIVPLIVNEKIEGVIELASFNEFKEHEIQFVERLAESIASSISGVKVNDRTKQLLEISQQQTEEMRAQEEEMRQNMEELQATQEEMHRKESDYLQEIAALRQELEEYKQNAFGKAA